MTLDAMHWVWTHSQAKGNTRLALLYVADQVRTPACEIRLGHRQIAAAMNTGSKSTVEAALKAAQKIGELEIAEEASGRRPALYRLSRAVGYTRPPSGSAPESGAQDFASAPKTRAQQDDQGSGSAPKSGAQGSVCAPDFDACAPKIGAPPHTHKEQASSEQPDVFTTCQPLITAMTNAGITVSWSMQPGDWLEIANIVRRAGVPAMVDFARDTKASTRQRIRYATFFLRGGWKGLPPRGEPRTQPREDTGPPPHCGHVDCDPISRTRDTEAPNGLRVSVRCPECHPASNDKDSAA